MMHYERVNTDLAQAEKTLKAALKSTVIRKQKNSAAGIAGTDTTGKGKMPPYPQGIPADSFYTWHDDAMRE